MRRTFPDANVEIINYHSYTKSNQIGFYKLNLGRQHLHPGQLFRHIQQRRRYRQIEEKCLEINASTGFFSDSYSEISSYLEKQSYDLLIVGSDTVLNFYEWNFDQDRLPIYWLPPELAATKVMLSSSIGTELTLDKLSAPLRQTLKQSIEDFTLLGVRDPMTHDFVAELAPAAIPRLHVMPDPTFSYDVDGSHAEYYLKSRNIHPNIPIIGLDLSVKVPGISEAVRYFKRKGYCVAVWRGGAKVADYNFSDMNPLEWAGMFSLYSVVLTNRFHASIFSLKNLTPVIAVDHKPNRVTASLQSKCSLLLESFGLRETHYCYEPHSDQKDWFISTIEATLAEPPIPQIQIGLKARRIEFDAYMNRIRGLFNLPPIK